MVQNFREKKLRYITTYFNDYSMHINMFNSLPAISQKEVESDTYLPISFINNNSNNDSNGLLLLNLHKTVAHFHQNLYEMK